MMVDENLRDRSHKNVFAIEDITNIPVSLFNHSSMLCLFMVMMNVFFITPPHISAMQLLSEQMEDIYNVLCM